MMTERRCSFRFDTAIRSLDVHFWDTGQVDVTVRQEDNPEDYPTEQEIEFGKKLRTHRLDFVPEPKKRVIAGPDHPEIEPV